MRIHQDSTVPPNRICISDTYEYIKYEFRNVIYILLYLSSEPEHKSLSPHKIYNITWACWYKTLKHLSFYKSFFRMHPTDPAVPLFQIKFVSFHQLFLRLYLLNLCHLLIRSKMRKTTFGTVTSRAPIWQPQIHVGHKFKFR